MPTTTIPPADDLGRRLARLSITAELVPLHARQHIAAKVADVERLVDYLLAGDEPEDR